jgi:hypothetical protein
VCPVSPGPDDETNGEIPVNTFIESRAPTSSAHRMTRSAPLICQGPGRRDHTDRALLAPRTAMALTESDCSLRQFGGVGLPPTTGSLPGRARTGVTWQAHASAAGTCSFRPFRVEALVAAVPSGHHPQPAVTRQWLVEPAVRAVACLRSPLIAVSPVLQRSPPWPADRRACWWRRPLPGGHPPGSI